MDPTSIPLEEFLRDPDSGRSRFGAATDLIVVSAGEYETALQARERAQLVQSVREAMQSFDRGEGTLLEDLQAEYAEEDARAENAA